VSGADPVTERRASWTCSDVCEQWAKTILVESPTASPRDLAVQLAGHDMLKGMALR